MTTRVSEEEKMSLPSNESDQAEVSGNLYTFTFLHGKKSSEYHLAILADDPNANE